MNLENFKLTKKSINPTLTTLGEERETSSLSDKSEEVIEMEEWG